MSDYPAGMTFRPIEHWPGELTADRIRSPFSAPLSSTLRLLWRELSHLSSDPRRYVESSVLQIALREQDFRITDGMPRACAKAEHPGVILAVESAKGPLSFPCDRFLTWRDNLRAIVLALEALRRIERYGITPNGEQYTGWLQLPAPTVPSTMSADEAESALRYIADLVPATDIGVVYRRARFRTHPDRGGDRAQWQFVEDAAAALRAAGRLS